MNPVFLFPYEKWRNRTFTLIFPFSTWKEGGCPPWELSTSESNGIIPDPASK